MMNVGQICSRDVDLVGPDETVREAARRMLERRVGTLIAVDGDGTPTGLVTDRDLALRTLASGGDPAEMRVGDVITRRVRSIPEHASVDLAVAEMRSGSCRRLAVVDASGKLVGVVSLDDLFQIVAEQMRELSGVLHNVSGLLQRESPHPMKLDW